MFGLQEHQCCEIYKEGHGITRHSTTFSDICRYLIPRLCRPGVGKFLEIALIQLEILFFSPPPFGVNSDQFSSNLRVEQIALPRHLSRFLKQPGSPALQKSNGLEVVQGFRSLHQAPRFSFLLSYHQPKWANCEIPFAIRDTPPTLQSPARLRYPPIFIYFFASLLALRRHGYSYQFSPRTRSAKYIIHTHIPTSPLVRTISIEDWVLTIRPSGKGSFASLASLQRNRLS